MTRYHTTAAGNVPFTAEEETARDLEEVAHLAGAGERLAKAAREKRDKLLAATDWVVLRAKELGQPVPLATFEYRGDLRQVPDQVGFPTTIIWPEEI